MAQSQPELIAGRYQVRERLGQGGMGVVHLAHDQELPRLVAVKVLRDDDPELHERFAREARLAASLDHPNIVTIYDRGIHNGQPFIVMQYIAGESLDELIRRRAPLPVARKLQMIAELCDGLAFAHRVGVVHRDVKPANIKISREGVVKILDFGIARQMESGMTCAGSVIGTISYMSPEQVSGQPVDHRSDQFSVGLVLYELLVFQKAFPGDERVVPNLILTSEPKPLQSFTAQIDPALIQVVNRSIRKNPDERYPDLPAMRKDLLRVAERLESITPQPALSTDEQFAPTVLKEKPSSRSAPPKSDAGRFAQIRRVQIEALIDRAQHAFALGDFDSVIAVGEKAAILDPDDARIQELLAKAGSALDERQVRAWLKEAQGHIDAGSLTAASDLVGRALELVPEATDAIAMQARLRLLREERERAAQRERAVQQVLHHARRALQDGAFEAAIRAGSEVLAHDPANREAEEIRGRARAALDERRVREEEVARRAAEQEALRRADGEAAARRASEIEAKRRAELEADQRRRLVIDEALASAAAALLNGDIPAAEAQAQSLEQLGTAADALADLRSRIDRSRATHAESQKREEHDRRAASTVNASRRDFAAGKVEAALEQLQAFIPPHPLVTAALAQLQQEAAAAERLKKAQAAATVAGRRRASAEQLAEARTELDAGRFSKALAAIEAVLAQDPTQKEALGLREEVQKAQENAAVTGRARETVAESRNLATAGRYDEAIARLERFAPPHPLVTSTLETLRVVVTTYEARARESVTEARRLFESGSEFEAVAALEAFSPVHPEVTEALTALRAMLEQQERAAASTLARAQDLEQLGQLVDAIALLGQMTPAPPSVRQALTSLRERHAQMQRRRISEEKDRDAAYEKGIAKITRALNRHQVDKAEQQLAQLRTEFPQAAELELLGEEIRKQQQTPRPAARRAAGSRSLPPVWAAAAAVVAIAAAAGVVTWLRHPGVDLAPKAVLSAEPVPGQVSVSAPAPVPLPGPTAQPAPLPLNASVPAQAPVAPKRVPLPEPTPLPLTTAADASVPVATPVPTPAPVLAAVPLPTPAPAPNPVPLPVTAPSLPQAPPSAPATAAVLPSPTLPSLAAAGVADDVLRELLDKFSRAWGSGRVDQFRQAFPSLRERTEALQAQMRGACSSVSVEFMSIEVQNRTAKTARVETKSKWGCKLKVAGGRIQAEQSTDLFDMAQADNGAWTITRMFLGGV